MKISDNEIKEVMNIIDIAYNEGLLNNHATILAVRIMNTYPNMKKEYDYLYDIRIENIEWHATQKELKK